MLEVRNCNTAEDDTWQVEMESQEATVQKQ